MSQRTVWQQILDYSNRADPYPLYAELRKTRLRRGDEPDLAARMVEELRQSPTLRGPRHLLIEIDGVDPAQHRPA